ncbi:hypothetical protein GA0111570_101407 [Raineyella antarctica]|uniref:Peptidase MA superfamily protein n=1 Tax=Raineyella antarctica TaxID=1577474 RepID=A0A1G6GDQ0_9ACTN|nr:hypothetical protein [Raineyella antarctica]SDB80132.1 hypothetical protein GA0111570_101407 [Raineyella antarctica]
MPFQQPAAVRPGLAAAVTLLVLSLLLAVSLSPVGAPDRPAGSASAGQRSLALEASTVVRMRDGTRVACAEPADCQVWAVALAAASRALDPVLPAVPPFSAVTVIAPTLAGQVSVVGNRSQGIPAATTLLVGDDLVRRGVASPQDRGRVWIVVNPAVTRAGGELPTRVLTHELVHVRTRAADLAGPLWVEEGYAVAVTERVLGPSAAIARPGPGTGDTLAPPAWPSDDWVPSTTEDYAVAGAVVKALAGRIGWNGVARWYAATGAGAGSRTIARNLEQQITGGRRARS